MWRNQQSGVARLRTLLEMIKVQHSVFALPFAIVAALRAADGCPPLATLGWIVLAMVTARSAAMAFNRLVDRRYDAENPRTAGRHLPRGIVSPAWAAGFTLASVVLFAVACWRLNRTAFLLSPVALAIVLGYSFTKRFTWTSHFVLGLGLALGPIGAWVGVTGRVLDPFPLLLGLSVLLWTAGFDLIYACQDAEFDRRTGLHSFPARFGVPPALALSSLLHVGMVASLAAAGRIAGEGPFFWAGVAIVAVLLVIEHRLVHPDDLSKAEVAFFQVNAAVGFVVLAAVALEVALK